MPWLGAVLCCSEHTTAISEASWKPARGALHFQQLHSMGMACRRFWGRNPRRHGEQNFRLGCREVFSAFSLPHNTPTGTLWNMGRILFTYMCINGAQQLWTQSQVLLFQSSIKCKLPWRERDSANVGFTSGLPTLQQELGERNRVLIRTFRCVGVSRNKQHSTTEQPGSGFISISCHFSAAKFVNFISRASLPCCAILLEDLPCDGLGNVRCALSFTACWKQELKLQSLQLQAFIQSYFGQTYQSYSR